MSLPATLLQSSNSFTNDLTPIKAKKGKRNEQKREPWSIKKKRTVLRNTEQARFTVLELRRIRNG